MMQSVLQLDAHYEFDLHQAGGVPRKSQKISVFRDRYMASGRTADRSCRWNPCVVGYLL